MVFTHTWGGDPSHTSGYVDGTVLLTQNGIGAPSGNLDLSGNRPLRIGNVAADYLSGGDGRSVAISLSGNVIGGSFETVADPATSFQFRVQSNGGRMYYGRNEAYAWQIYENGAAGFTAALCGSFQWGSVPGKPSGVTLTMTGRNARIQYGYPAADGGFAVSSYTLGYTRLPPGGGWSGWINHVSDADGDYTFTGLNPGWQYAFRVYANNAVGSGQFVQTATVTIPTTGDRFDGTVWKDQSIGRRFTDSDSYVDLSTGKRFDGAAWVDFA